MIYVSQTIYVTPRMAREWLTESKKKNRPIVQKQVERLVKDMKDGKWRDDGSPIKFDRAGNILDGQHRLTACIEAGFSFYALVVRDLDEDTFLVMDQVKPRTASDNLFILGKGSPGVLSSAASWVLRYKKRKGQLAPRIERADVVRFCMETPHLEDCVTWATKKRGTSLVPLSLAAAMLFIFSEIDEADADSFMNQVMTGANLAEKTPALVLREKIIAGKGTAHRSFDRDTPFALAVYCWNAFRQGRPIQRVMWKEGDDFPAAR